MLRPPYVETDTEPVPGPKAGMMAQVFAGVWQMRDKSKTVLFLINVSKEKSSFKMRFNPDEYGISNLPEEFKTDENGAYLEGVMEPCDIRVWEL